MFPKWYKRNTPDSLSGVLCSRWFPVDTALEPFIFGWLDELYVDWVWNDETGETVEDIKQAIQVMLKGYGPMAISSIVAFAGTLPQNVLLCDGTQYLRTDYPALYAVLDADLIVDADHFTVPDLRGRAIIGSGQGSGLSNRVDGQVLGTETHQLVESEIPSHNHSVHTHGVSLNIEEPIPGAPYPISTPQVIPGTTGNTGGDGYHNNMQPSAVRKWGIVAW